MSQLRVDQRWTSGLPLGLEDRVICCVKLCLDSKKTISKRRAAVLLTRSESTFSASVLCINGSGAASSLLIFTQRAIFRDL